MFKLEQDRNVLEFVINGYNSIEHRYDDDSWATFYAKVTTKAFSFEINTFDIQSCEIDSLKKMLDNFIKNDMKENEFFSPIEESFLIRFYPKGIDYGKIYDSSGKLVEKKELELFISIPDDVFISSTYIRFLLDIQEAIKFREYIFDVICNEW